MGMGGETFGGVLLYNVAPKTCRAMCKRLRYKGTKTRRGG
jgi:hypothetical protein